MTPAAELGDGERTRGLGPGVKAHATGGRLADNLVHFARVLRKAGLPIGPGSVIDAIAAVEAARIGAREDFYWTLHAVFVTRHEHTVVFDEAFRLFWRKKGYVEKLLAMMTPVAPAAPQQREPNAASRRINDALNVNRPETPREPPRETQLDARLTFSDREVLQRKDFAQMTAEEIAAARKAIAGLVLADDARPVRRLAPVAHARSARVDLRRTLRRSLRSAGATIDLAWRARRHRPPPIVALLDISGSMSEYSRIFLHFLHALTEKRRVTTFLFGTRLTNVTRSLKRRDPDEALAMTAAQVPDWSGGTRIGPALAAFNKHWSRRVLGEGAIVLLITDGLERDPDRTLKAEIERLHRSTRRLIWLNPLLRFEGFEARASGVRTILAHVDEFRPVHNLSSIARLCAALSGGGVADGEPKRHLKRVESGRGR